MLEVRNLEAGYGSAQVLFGVDLNVAQGEVVALLGRNGMGKSTTVQSIMGLLPPFAGSILVDGKELAGKPPFQVAQAGLGLVPEGRRIFPNLTVRENLLATAMLRSDRNRKKQKWNLESVFALFPSLAQRVRHFGSQLSGGEQQMLAIGRALMTNPRMLILDEVTEGLAPLVRTSIWACLAHLKEEGEAILVIDKHIDHLTRLADRHFVLEKGRIVWYGTNQTLIANPSVIDRYLHL